MFQPPADDAIETATLRFTMLPSGILRAETLRAGAHTAAEARANLVAVEQANGGVRRPIVVVSRHGVTLEPGARDIYAAPEVARIVSALAVAVATSNVVSRVAANFVFGLRADALPTKLFAEEGPALQWAVDFLEAVPSHAGSARRGEIRAPR